MKNQYVADINDYVKYSIVRELIAGTRDRAGAICWMLTDDDNRTDGNLRAYLEAPERFRDFDPVVFDALRGIADENRSVAAVERTRVLGSPSFFSRVLADDLELRRRYFDAFWSTVRPGSLLFFDPDNGLGVQSVPKGRRNSAKYLYWDELALALGYGCSCVVYQHFPRVQRDQYVASLLETLCGLAPETRACFALCTSRVAYVVAPALHDERALRQVASSVEQRWKGLLRFVA